MDHELKEWLYTFKKWIFEQIRDQPIMIGIRITNLIQFDCKESFIQPDWLSLANQSLTGTLPDQPQYNLCYATN
jgi:hypothetical protein